MLRSLHNRTRNLVAVQKGGEALELGGGGADCSVKEIIVLCISEEVSEFKTSVVLMKQLC